MQNVLGIPTLTDVVIPVKVVVRRQVISRRSNARLAACMDAQADKLESEIKRLKTKVQRLRVVADAIKPKTIRKEFMKELRKNVFINAEKTRSDKRKKTQRLLLKNVTGVVSTAHSIRKYIDDNNIMGITIESHIGIEAGSALNTEPYIILHFDHSMYKTK